MDIEPALTTRTSADFGLKPCGISFASTAVAELHEEVGLHVDEADLVAFGTLSELHAFSIMFEVRRGEAM